MKCQRCRKCDVDCFDSLILKYSKQDALESAAIENALYEVKDVIQYLKEAREHVCEKDMTGSKMDEWLERCLEQYETRWPECRCEELRVEFHELKGQIEDLEEECLEIAKLLRYKIKEVMALNDSKDELLEQIEEKCYPTLNNCK